VAQLWRPPGSRNNAELPLLSGACQKKTCPRGKGETACSETPERRFCLCAEHVRRRLGCKSPTNLMEVKVSEAQGRDREEASERSVEQRREPMYKNRIRGRRLRTSWQMAAKSITIKAVGCKFGGCALKVVELTSGDLPFVVESRLGSGQPVPTGRQKSAAGVLVRKRMKAQTVLRKEGNGRDK